jgi:hypothetical protein
MTSYIPEARPDDDEQYEPLDESPDAMDQFPDDAPGVDSARW